MTRQAPILRADKVKLLKSLRLLERVPARDLAALADSLKPQAYVDGAVVFEEGARGDSLFFVSSGRVRITKKVIEANGSPALKDVALLLPGECFGEMALFDEKAPRSARAAASGDAVLFQLGRGELRRWLQSHPKVAIDFFTELTQILSQRLRRSSNESTLLFDLSQWLLEPVVSGKELLQKMLRHLVPHLEGTWTAAAYLYNEFNDEMELVATEGDFQTQARYAAIAEEFADSWLDEQTFVVCFPGKKNLQGHIIFRAGSELGGEEKNETARMLTTTARLIASALENIGFRAEETMRGRLQQSRGYGEGL